MATDSANLPQGETYLAADSDMSGGELDPTQIQLAQTDGAQPVELPKGNLVAMIPVRPGQVIELSTDSTDGLLAKIGPEGNLAIVVDGRTIILQGYVSANDQAPVRIVTSGMPGSASRRLRPIAKLKFGTSETTISGRLSRQNFSSRRTCAGRYSASTRCMPRMSCGEPSVQPFLSIRL